MHIFGLCPVQAHSSNLSGRPRFGGLPGDKANFDYIHRMEAELERARAADAVAQAQRADKIQARVLRAKQAMTKLVPLQQKAYFPEPGKDSILAALDMRFSYTPLTLLAWLSEHVEAYGAAYRQEEQAYLEKNKGLAGKFRKKPVFEPNRLWLDASEILRTDIPEAYRQHFERLLEDMIQNGLVLQTLDGRLAPSSAVWDLYREGMLAELELAEATRSGQVETGPGQSPEALLTAWELKQWPYISLTIQDPDPILRHLSQPDMIVRQVAGRQPLAVPEVATPEVNPQTGPTQRREFFPDFGALYEKYLKADFPERTQKIYSRINIQKRSYTAQYASGDTGGSYFHQSGNHARYLAKGVTARDYFHQSGNHSHMVAKGGTGPTVSIQHGEHSEFTAFHGTGASFFYAGGHDSVFKFKFYHSKGDTLILEGDPKDWRLGSMLLQDENGQSRPAYVLQNERTQNRVYLEQAGELPRIRYVNRSPAEIAAILKQLDADYKREIESGRDVDEIAFVGRVASLWRD